MLGSLGFVLLAAAAGATPCESLRTVSLSQATIVTADIVEAGPFVQPAAAGRGAAPAGAPRGRPAGAAQVGARCGAPGAPAAQSIPRHCRVTMVLKPSSDSKSTPSSGCRPRTGTASCMMMGNGGFAGSIQGYGDMQVALRLGYAPPATDTGHTAADGPNGMFALGHPEKIVDFSTAPCTRRRSKSKQLIKEFYDRAAQYSYFKGCSTGGRRR